jgi:hypothetical protein
MARDISAFLPPKYSRRLERAAGGRVSPDRTFTATKVAPAKPFWQSENGCDGPQRFVIAAGGEKTSTTCSDDALVSGA